VKPYPGPPTTLGNAAAMALKVNIKKSRLRMEDALPRTRMISAPRFSEIANPGDWCVEWEDEDDRFG
jgi:hypothetical protein